MENFFDSILGAPKPVGTLVPRSIPQSQADLSDKSGEVLSRPQGPFDPQPCAVPCDDVADINDIFFITIPLGGGTALADVLVMLPKPYRQFFLASVPNAHATDKLMFHLRPIGNQALYTGLSIVATGNESWIPMHGNTVGTPVIKFCKPVSKFYLDVDRSAGAGLNQLTIGCSNDLDTDFFGIPL